MCFCLKTPYLIYIVDVLTLNSQPAALWLMPEQSFPHTRIFSGRHITASLHLGTLGSLSVLPLGTIVNSKIANRKHRNGGNAALNRPRKGSVFTVGDLKQKGKMSPCPTSSGSVCIRQRQYSTLCACVRMTAESMSIDFWCHEYILASR